MRWGGRLWTMAIHLRCKLSEPPRGRFQREEKLHGSEESDEETEEVEEATGDQDPAKILAHRQGLTRQRQADRTGRLRASTGASIWPSARREIDTQRLLAEGGSRFHLSRYATDYPQSAWAQHRSPVFEVSIANRALADARGRRIRGGNHCGRAESDRVRR